MSKPSKTEAELIAMAKAELTVHADCSGRHRHFGAARRRQLGIPRQRRCRDDGKPGYPERVAMLVQIGDHLSKQFDVKG